MGADNMRHKTRKAFSFVELLIAMIVIGVVGGVATLALWFAFNTFYQMDDYTAAEAEIEHAF
jgi:prepilin-type N-terminal cleavage/methylation domain-containing protein